MISECDDSFCEVTDGSCVQIPAEFVAVNEEQLDANSAQAVAITAGEPAVTSQVERGREWFIYNIYI